MKSKGIDNGRTCAIDITITPIDEHIRKGGLFLCVALSLVGLVPCLFLLQLIQSVIPGVCFRGLRVLLIEKLLSVCPGLIFFCIFIFMPELLCY